jgi:signal transduction histidine kinase
MDMSLEIARLFLNSIPSSIIGIYAFVIFLGEDKKLWNKLIFLGFVFGVVTWLTYQLTPSFHVIRIPLNILSFFVIFKFPLHISWLQTTKYFFVFLIFTLIPETIGVGVLELYGYTMNQVIMTPVLMALLLPFYIASIPVAYVAGKFRTPLLSFFVSLKENLKLPQFRTYFISTFLMFVLITGLYFQFTEDANFAGIKMTVIRIAFLLIVFLAAFTIYHRVRFTEKTTIAATQNVLSDNLAGLLNSIRSQRHDFVNHIQVITSLTQMKKYSDLDQYLSLLSGEISLLNDVLKVDNPFVSALLNAKLLLSETKGIKFDVDVNASLASLSTRALDITRVLGNLIDNAIEVVEKQSTGDKWIRVNIGETGPLLSFSVENPGSLSEEEQENIFTPGFTTKGESHSGLGLYICQQLARKLHGSIDHVIGATSSVKFSLLIPKV